MSAVTQEQVKAKKNELKRKTPASWLVFFGVLLLVIVWLFPFWMAVANALKTQEEFIRTGPLSLPTNPTFSHITKFWNDVDFPRKLMNSIIVSLVAPVIKIGRAHV